MKLEYVKRHENSTEHKNFLQILDPSQTSIKGVNQMLGMEAGNVVIQMHNIYFFSSKNISINVYLDLANLVNYQKENPTSLVSDTPLQVLRSPTLPHQQKTIQTPRSNYATYTNKVNGHELLGSLKGLSADKLYHFGSDRASNITGIRNGLAALLKK
ncbi:hypothetical protein C1646_795889 [Rhizophagus diaphanus]|nr:hypothetical protein C1646_795889 [Rhizophagus diaphanus] [Rhizophagus sp. MUCL 43196]